MPEGPEVKIIAEDLNTAIVGRDLTNICWSVRSRYKEGMKNFSSLVFPLCIEKITSKGKKIIIHLQGGISLVSSLAMEGRWTWEKGKHSNLWLELGEDRLYFDDSRHFGALNIYLTQEDLAEKLSKIGPDLLSEEITLKQWLGKIRNKRLQKKKVGNFLMEQKYFSGIGNYLRAEILYKAEISPHRPLKDITDEEGERLLLVSQDKLKESYLCGGLTIKSFLSLEGKRGIFHAEIYGKKQDALGNPVIREKFSGRTVHWVPALQC